MNENKQNKHNIEEEKRRNKFSNQENTKTKQNKHEHQTDTWHEEQKRGQKKKDVMEIKQ